MTTLEIYTKAMASLQDRSGTIEQIFVAMAQVDPVATKSLIFHDLLTVTIEAKAKSLVTSAYDAKQKADVITLKR